MTRRLLRHRVVASAEPQMRRVHSDPLHAVAERLGVGEDAQHIVDFWAEGNIEEDGTARSFIVLGTGQPIPDDARYWVSTGRTSDGLVWHLYEVPRA
ncbi:hypothetical protein ACIBAC_28995 [Streptomyces sp. NPDC051362]|uniref:DUF7352 domain-containing protein n=1 Tax=Streptomyces sp. NPDC051362 TaxID=3365651 RepID=UPI00378FB0E9